MVRINDVLDSLQQKAIRDFRLTLQKRLNIIQQIFYLKTYLFNSRGFLTYISYFQSLPVISSLEPITSILPLVFVVFISIAREGLEDYKRYKSDKNLNNHTIQKLNLDPQNQIQFDEIKWMHLKVGDIVKIQKDQEIPADLIILNSSDENGVVFIQTGSLDGENSLKQKQQFEQEQIHQFLNNSQSELLKEMTFTAQAPNQNIHEFQGSFNYKDDPTKLIQSQNFIMKGCQLRNTQWVICIVVYTGLNTKIMQNSEISKSKQSKISLLISKYLIYIFLTQNLICLLVAILGFSDRLQQNQLQIIPYQQNDFEQFVISYLSTFVLIQTFYPQSLPVSLEIVRAMQIYFLNNDGDMSEKNKIFKIQTYSINEELGQIDIIFSDKTGTLTCNQMIFKSCMIGQQQYLNENGDIQQNQFYNNYLKEEINDCLVNQNNIYHFLLIMSVCHDCIIEQNTENQQKTDIQQFDLNYQGISPDEICIVNAAKELGFIYQGEQKGVCTISINGVQKKIQILHKFQFDSDRKRMSVLIKDDDQIKLLIKGADSVILERQNPDFKDEKETLKYLEQNSMNGFRMLSFAIRNIDQNDFQQFKDECIKLSNDTEREEKILKLSEKFENNLEIIGCTAIEDKLQENVPQLLDKFLQANIQVYMLTGDKLETAENIGKSCNLINNEMINYKMTSKTQIDARIDLTSIICSLDKTKKNFLIIDGIALQNIAQDAQMSEDFSEILNHFVTIICCRSTPKQKSFMVKLAKNRGKITLAVGDGANDCNMIQEANIGVGIYGNEGMRAVQVSDFAIGQFQYLEKLILFHGRQNYIRISEMALYFFYKNVTLTISQIFFQFISAYSGQTIYESFFITLYNMIFTAWPVMIKAVFDFDFNTKYYLKINSKYHMLESQILINIQAKLYYIGQKNTILNAKNLVFSMTYAILVSFFIFMLTLVFIDQNFIMNSEGKQIDFWFVSLILYTTIITNAQIIICFFTKYFTFVHALAYTVFSYFLFLFYFFISSYFTGVLQNVTIYISQFAIFFLYIFFFFSVYNNEFCFLTDNLYKQRDKFDNQNIKFDKFFRMVEEISIFYARIKSLQQFKYRDVKYIKK